MKRCLALLMLVAVSASAEEIVIDFEQAEIGKPTPTWTEKDVVFNLAAPPARSKAKGRIMFFPHLGTNRKGIVNAMATEQSIPVQATFPNGASAVLRPMLPSLPPAAAMFAIFWLKEQVPRSTSTICPASTPGVYGLAPAAYAQQMRLPFVVGGVIGALILGIFTEWALIIVSATVGVLYVTDLFTLSPTAETLVAAGLFIIGALTQVILMRMQKQAER